MCGIAGIISDKLTSEQLKTRLCSMRDRMQHRGPDDDGTFIDNKAGLGLAHRRLSILDLSESGHQPMQAAGGRFTIVFNGEIYNFRELRDELTDQGVHFQSQSDTEVLLQLYAKHGAALVDRLAGMFALAIWDRDEQRLFIARDALGIKPIYIWRDQNQLAFASELRTVLASRIAPSRADKLSLAQCLMFGSVQEPKTVVENIELLPAGQTLTWHRGSVQTTCYWDLKYANELTDRETSLRLTRAALDDSIRRHFVSDVPVGIFLSGGIDSTAVLALAKANGYDQIKTFCVSFDEAEFNEGGRAARTARHFGTDHHDWRMTPEQGGELVDDYLNSLDQPGNDGFNTYCVSKFASVSGMKVVLSGLGGDELFGGYPTFAKVPKLMRWHRTTRKLGIRDLAANALPSLSRWSQRRISESFANRLSCFLKSDGGPVAAYWTMRAFFTPSEAEKLVQHLTGECPAGSAFDTLNVPVPPQPTDKDTVGYLEATRYLRNQLLRDSDVYSMAHGLELRVPLVDRHLYQTINQIPSTIRHARGKQLFIDAVPEIPKWISEAPKGGFRFPFERWVKNQWSPMFDEMDRTSPIRMGAWYRKWTYFTLQHFLRSNNLL